MDSKETSTPPLSPAGVHQGPLREHCSLCSALSLRRRTQPMRPGDPSFILALQAADLVLVLVLVLVLILVLVLVLILDVSFGLLSPSVVGRSEDEKLFGRHEPSSVQLWVSYNRQPMKAAQFMTRHPITVSLLDGGGGVKHDEETRVEYRVKHLFRFIRVKQ
ncbi:Sortilin-related receptor [Liparis tanakae]|uniref:Sortilin-related receptor n=1 Tax=Liparis tanakae TaxID=230148 RepID=A0A4Z2EI08_9TELE|nr:Sortilin-related receptor [Liparis tanakae]